jgi:hypothetical protein
LYVFSPAGISTRKRFDGGGIGHVVYGLHALGGLWASGAGPWSGYPAYEDIASRMLLAYRPDELIGALDSSENLAEAEMEGAARFFSGYTYGAAFRPREDTSLIDLLSQVLKKTLLDHVVRTGDADRISRAQRALRRNSYASLPD